VPGLALQALLARLPGRAKERFPRIYWRVLGWILGLEIRMIGAQVTNVRPVLFAANHSSWLDIVALGSVLPASFIAKNEIAGWPVVGTVARLGRTEFVSRGRATLKEEQHRMAERLNGGDNFILFPEGTTSDGNRVLPFLASFLTLARRSRPCSPWPWCMMSSTACRCAGVTGRWSRGMAIWRSARMRPRCSNINLCARPFGWVSRLRRARFITARNWGECWKPRLAVRRVRCAKGARQMKRAKGARRMTKARGAPK